MVKKLKVQVRWPLWFFLLFSLCALQLSQAAFQSSARITTSGATVSPKSPTASILFGYGGESGRVGATIGGFEHNYANWYEPRVKATYESSPVRTGTRAVRMWTVGGATESNYRRMHLKKGTVEVAGETWYGGFENWDQQDLYASIWVNIPSDNPISTTSTSWVDLFGFQAYWRGDNNPKGSGYRGDRTNWRFKLENSGGRKYFVCTYVMEWFNPDYYDVEKFWANGNGGRPLYWMSASNTTLCDTWIHLQVFMHWSQTAGQGYYTAWINDDLLANYTTPVANDPRGWSRWDSENCDWVYPECGQPAFLIELYHATDEPEMWYFWDDAVASTTYVPSSYRVWDNT